MEHLKNNSQKALKYLKLDDEWLRITSYSNKPFLSNEDNICQLRYFIFLLDKYNDCKPIHWTYYKSKLVGRPFHGSELITFTDALYREYTIKYNLRNIIELQIKPTMYTDTLFLLGVLLKATTTEKLLIVD